MDPYADLPAAPGPAPGGSPPPPASADGDPYADLPSASTTTPDDPYADLPSTSIEPPGSPPGMPSMLEEGPSGSTAQTSLAGGSDRLEQTAKVPYAQTDPLKKVGKDARTAIYDAFTHNRLTREVVEQAIKLGILKRIDRRQPQVRDEAFNTRRRLNTAAAKESIPAVRSFFEREAGYSKAGIAGILGNIMQESQGDPEASGDNGDSYGLFQHNRPRKRALQAYAASVGRLVSDPLVQAAFALKELQTQWPGLHQFLQKVQDPEQAAMVFGKVFENPHEDHAKWERRRAFARQLHQ